MEEAMAAFASGYVVGMKIKALVSLSNDERIKEELRIHNLEVIHRRMN